MNTALWQVGWGYFLTNMIGAETGLSMASVDWARGHFLDYVRAGGPLPALRCRPPALRRSAGHLPRPVGARRRREQSPRRKRG